MKARGWLEAEPRLYVQPPPARVNKSVILAHQESCARKIAMTPEHALAEADRLQERYPEFRYAAYGCWNCGNWHVGRRYRTDEFSG